MTSHNVSSIQFLSRVWCVCEISRPNFNRLIQFIFSSISLSLYLSLFSYYCCYCCYWYFISRRFCCYFCSWYNLRCFSGYYYSCYCCCCYCCCYCCCCCWYSYFFSCCWSCCLGNITIIHAFLTQHHFCKSYWFFFWGYICLCKFNPFTLYNSTVLQAV